MSLIILGYLAGMAHKFFNSFDFVFWLYVANLALVMCDFVLYFKYKEKPVKAEAEIIPLEAELPAAE